MMKCYLLLFLFVSTNLLALSQAEKIDEAWEMYNSDPSKSKTAINKQLDIALKEKNKRNEAKCLAYLGIIADIEGEPKKAIERLIKAIQIQEKQQYKKDLSYSYNNLGIAHFYQNNYDLALKYYSKSYAIDKELKDKTGAVGTLVNIGLVYTYKNNPNLAKKNYNLALNLYKELKDSAGLCTVYSNLAKLEYEAKDYSTCIFYYDLAKQNKPAEIGIEAEFTLFNGLANTYLKLDEYDKSIENGEIALAKAKAVNAKERLQYAYDVLSEAYAKKGDYKQSRAYLLKYTKLRDDLVNESMSSAIAEMETKYESKKKDNLILQSKAKADADQQRFNLRITVAISIMVMLLGMLTFFWYRNKAGKRNAVLLEERNHAIQDNLKQKEVMIGEIHHRVKNNLQLISSIIDLHARTLGEGKERSVLLDSRKRVESIALVHQKLYQNDEIYAIQLDEYFKELGISIIHNFQVNPLPVQLHITTDPGFIVHLDSAIPLGLILSEMITNSLKYAFKKESAESEEARIDIKLAREGKSLVVHYFDNGSGFQNDEWNASTSFGKKMIYSLLRQLKAEATVNGNQGFHAAIHCLNITWV